MLSLTATELPRFMSCNGSRLLQGIKPFNPDTIVTEEGNAVHWLIEQVFRGQITAEELIDRKAPNGVLITGDMVEHSSQFIDDMKGGDVEIDTSYGSPGWEIRGRADGLKFDKSVLIISDFKYGWKIIEPEKNWTLISHSIGWLSRNPFKPDTITFKIYQPRPFHPLGAVREWVINYDKLMELWRELKFTLENPSDQCTTSPHCYRCPSISQCQAHQVATMNSVDVAYRAYNSEVVNDDLSFILNEITRAEDILKQAKNAYEDLAMHRLREGQQIPNYSISNSYGQTRWKDGMDVDTVKAITGVDCSKKTLITPNQAKKAGVDEDVIKALTDRPSNGFKLVKIDAADKAEKLFK